MGRVDIMGRGEVTYDRARRYSGDVREDASEIAGDCVRQGRSVGWSGDLTDLDALRDLLRHFGIAYVCDLRGVWAPVDRSVRHPDA